MTIRRIDPSRGSASSSQGSREASTAADVRGAPEGTKKKEKNKKKNFPPTPDLGSDGGDVAGGEIARSKQRRKQKKNKKNRSPAPDLGSDGGNVAGGEITRPKQRRKQRRSTSPVSDGGPLLGTGTDEPQISDSRTNRCRPEEAKKSSVVVTLPLETIPDIQSPPRSVGLGNITRENAEQFDSIPNVIHHKQEKGPEEIEGLNWDDTKLGKEIQSYLDLFTYDLPPRDDGNFWYYRDDEQLKSLNERLALHRIRAHRILKGAKLEELKDAELMKEYPSEVLENEEYFVSFERDFEWYFEPEYTEHAGFQDYQRLVLQDTGDYLEWSYYHETLSTYEGDQEYVVFYENLSSKAEWIVNSLGVNWSEWSSYQRLAFYHALKNAESYPNIFISLIFIGFHEYIWSAAFDNLTCKGISDLYFELWKRVAKGKMDFIEALEQVNDLGICTNRCLDIKIELEYKPGSGGMRYEYETYISGIGEEVREDEARTLIMDAVKKFTRKPKTYYDYAKKKLGIARENGIIPPKASLNNSNGQ